MSQRIPERTDTDIHLFEWADVYRAAEVKRTKQMMRYTQADFDKDWELCVSLAMLSARPENKTDWSAMMDDCFVRIHAYLALHPEVVPGGNQ